MFVLSYFSMRLLVAYDVLDFLCKSSWRKVSETQLRRLTSNSKNRRLALQGIQSPLAISEAKLTDFQHARIDANILVQLADFAQIARPPTW